MKVREPTHGCALVLDERQKGLWERPRADKVSDKSYQGKEPIPLPLEPGIGAQECIA
jgi:hypothetical protein